MFWDHDSLNTNNIEVKMLIPPILFSLIFVRMCVCVYAIECTNIFFMVKCVKRLCISHARHCLSDAYCVIKMCSVCVAMGATVS